MAITGPKESIILFKKEMMTFWEMEDLGEVTCVVRIETIRFSKHHYGIHQRSMTESLLIRFGLADCKPASTPVQGGLKLLKSSPEEASEFAKLKYPYRSGVGSLMYISQCTRPDISYAVGVLSQHLDTPCQRHWDAFGHVLQYLRGTINLGIHYHFEDNRIFKMNSSWNVPLTNVDSDWAGCKNTRRSTTGYLTPLFGGAISWRSRLQQTVALSSTEAEYRATTEAGQEVQWLRLLLNDVGFNWDGLVSINCDNLGAIDLSSNAVHHGRTKH